MLPCPDLPFTKPNPGIKKKGTPTEGSFQTLKKYFSYRINQIERKAKISNRE